MRDFCQYVLPVRKSGMKKGAGIKLNPILAKDQKQNSVMEFVQNVQKNYTRDLIHTRKKTPTSDEPLKHRIIVKKVSGCQITIGASLTPGHKGVGHGPRCCKSHPF